MMQFFFSQKDKAFMGYLLLEINPENCLFSALFSTSLLIVGGLEGGVGETDERSWEEITITM